MKEEHKQRQGVRNSVVSGEIAIRLIFLGCEGVVWEQDVMKGFACLPGNECDSLVQWHATSAFWTQMIFSEYVRTEGSEGPGCSW